MRLNSLAERLKFARAQKNLTQEELARLAGTTQDVIQKIENRKSLRPRNIDRIARALDVSPAWLQFGAEEIDGLDKESLEIAMAYDKLTAEQKAMISAAIDALLKKKTA